MDATGRGPVVFLVPRLIRHDWILVARAARATFSTWRDGLIVPFMLTIGYLWLADLPRDNLFRVVLLAGLSVGFATLQIALSRIDYHRTEGIVAEDALLAVNTGSYLVFFISIAGTAFALLMAAVSIQAALMGLAALGAGLLFSGFARLVRHLSVVATGSARTVHAVFAWLRRRIAGFALAGMFALMGVLAMSAFSPEGLLGVIGVLVFLLSILLAQVDCHSVRFMAQSGYSPAQTFFAHQRGLAPFGALAPIISLILGGWEGLVIAGLVCLAVQVFVLVRILAYRVMSQRLADWFAAALIGLFALVGFLVPFALIPVMVIALHGVWRRARHTTWVIA